MKKEVFLALVTSIIEDTINNLDVPSGPRGQRGPKGSIGHGFELSEHLETIQSLLSEEIQSRLPDLKMKFADLSSGDISQLRGKDGKSVKVGDIIPLVIDYLENNKEEFSFKFEDLSEDHKESLRGHAGEKGARGQRGRQGIDGQDGKDFDLQENIELVKNILEDLKPKLSDFSDEDLELIRGHRGEKGPRGLKGKDFNLTENLEIIKEVVDELKPKISELSEDDIELIRGPIGAKGSRGQKGKSGKDFDFDDEKSNVLELLLENRNEIKLKYSDLTPEEVTEIKLKFEDLSDEDKNNLTLKFSHLTDEEVHAIEGPKGARGQRGKQGVQGETGIGKLGPRGIQGLPGLTGLTGYAGQDGLTGPNGKDGQDAPYIVDIEVVQVAKDKIYFIYEFSNGSRIETSLIEIPTNLETYYSFGGGGGSGGSGGGSTWLNGSGVPGAGLGSDGDYYLDNDNGDYYEKIAGTWTLTGNLQGTDGTNGTDGIDGIDGIDGTNGTDGNDASVSWYDEGVLIGLLGNVNFVGAGVTVVENPVGTLEVTIPGGGGATCLEVEDEYDPVTNCAKSINFIGPNVTVRPRVFMDAWPTLDDVVPSLSDYEGVGGNPENIDVYIDFEDPSIITDVDCDASVFVGSFVRMNGAGIALNALADSLLNSNVLGLVESKESATKCTIRVAGRSSAVFAGLDPTKDYFLSESAAGTIQTTAPIVAGEVKLKLGQPFSADSFFYNKGERLERA